MIQPVIQYAGFTPKALSITVVQSGPMELTARAGQFTTRGEAHILAAPTDDDINRRHGQLQAEQQALQNKIARKASAAAIQGHAIAIQGIAQQVDAMRAVRERVQAMAATGHAEMVDGHSRVRVWHRRDDGSFVNKSRTWPLVKDEVLPITSDPRFDVMYRITLGLTGPDGPLDVLVGSMLNDGIEVFAQRPAGWIDLHWLAQFLVPAGTTDLANVPIRVHTVLPGSPPGTTPDMFTMQGPTPAPSLPGGSGSGGASGGGSQFQACPLEVPRD